MIYYKCDALCIRTMLETDIRAFFEAFAAQGWEKSKPEALFNTYYKMQNSGQRAVIVAEKDGCAAGYATLAGNAASGPFRDKNLPEIIDFNVLKNISARVSAAGLWISPKLWQKREVKLSPLPSAFIRDTHQPKGCM